MADKVEKTHRHRNVIDDILDFLLAVIAFVYLMWHEQLGITMTDEQMAMAATFGATARVSIRKILMKLWGKKLPDSDEGAPKGASFDPPPRAENDDESDEGGA